MIKYFTSISGFKLGSLPVQYLGVPLVPGRLTDRDSRPLIEKIASRINFWAVKKLSYVGRLQLVQAVIYSLVNFCRNTFILPKKVRAVEERCKVFLWKGSNGDSEGAKVNWATICSPKAKGGLGIKSIETWYMACGLRFIWMLFAQVGSVLIAWVKL